MKFISLFAALFGVSSAQNGLSKTLFTGIEKVFDNAACNATFKPVCDAIKGTIALANGSGNASLGPVGMACAVYNTSSTRNDLTILVNLGGNATTECSSYLGASCASGQHKSTLGQVLNILRCVLSNVGPTLSNLLKTIVSSLSATGDILQIVELIVLVLLDKVVKALCTLDLSAIYPGVLAAVAWIVLSVGASLTVALPVVGVALFVLLLIVLGLVLGLGTLLAPVVAMLGATLKGLQPTVVQAVKAIFELLFGKTSASCGASNSQLTNLISTLVEPLFKSL